MAAHRIDLEDVLVGLTTAVTSANALHAKEVDADRRAAAAMTRELLHLADRLQALSAVIRSEYWAAKGEDPLL